MTQTISTIRQQHTAGLAWRATLASAAFLVLAACASTPLPPTAELQAAELAITGAEQARVMDYAVEELNQARTKLASARSAVQDENMVLATYLAEESRVSAELATARTEMAKAKAVNDEMQVSLDALRQELQRNTGAR